MLSKQGRIIDRREMLKVKIKSLAAEAKIIRHEERKARGILSLELREHRITVVRRASRETHLAYGLIRGKTLEQMEGTSKSQPDWESVRKMIKKYGPRDFVEPEYMRPILKKAA